MSGLPLKHLAAIPVLFLLYFYGLSGVGMLGPDEPRYASIGREMAVSGDWVTPRLWGQPWFEKPALLYWLIALGYTAGLNDDLAPRVPLAILSAAFLVFFFHQIRREFGETAALFSVIILATSVGWLAYSQVAVTDIPLAATFSGALLLCLPWVRSGGRRGLVIGGVLLGCAVLAKGLVPLVLILPVLAVVRRRWPDLLIFFGSAVAIALPWYFLCWLENGQAFVDEFFWRHHFSRFVSGELKHVQPWWFYLPVLTGFLFPWTPMLAPLFQKAAWQDKRRLLLLLTILWGLLFFSISSNKLPGYILPLLPPIAAAMGVALAEHRGSPWIFGISGFLTGLFAPAAAILPAAMVDGLSRAAWSIPFWAFAALPVGLAAWILDGRKHRLAAFGAIAASTVLAIVSVKTLTYPTLDQVVSARPVWRKLQVTEQKERCVGDVSKDLLYGLNFYAGQQMRHCEASRVTNYNNLYRDIGVWQSEGKQSPLERQTRQ
ncbi:MAG: glycosyltransferase family 39 protein [Bryobacteraceae bacterium]